MREIIFGVVGGLAVFLYGMGLLSEGLKSAAGDRLRQVLERITRWPLIAMLTGAGVTCLIQSSSATAVIVVGLVNAGLLSLKQAISVILGANVGTTITAWLVSLMVGLEAFKISTYAMPFIAVGFVMNTFMRRPKLKTWGQVLLGLGLLFLGLHLMKEVLGGLQQENSPIKDILQNIGDQPIYAVLAGALFTMVIQSSSASIAMVIVIASGGGFGDSFDDALRVAIPFVLGGNIGTTITAQLAAMRTNLSGKRAAMAHTLFNVIGVVVVLPFVYWGLYGQLIEYVGPWEKSLPNVGYFIAVAHSAFNICAALIILPFIGLLEKMVLKMLPTRSGQLEEMPVVLEVHLLDTPALAIDQARREIVRMCRTAKSAVNLAVRSITYNDQAALNKVARKEDAIDDFQNQITRYLVELSQRHLDPKIASELPVLLHTVNDIERVGDHATNITEIAQRKIDQRKDFSEPAEKELARMRMEVAHMFDNVLLAVEMSDQQAALKALQHEDTINQLQLDYRRAHIDRLSSGRCDVITGLTYIDFINNLEKIGDHLANVAQGVLGGLQWDHQYDAAEENNEFNNDLPDDPQSTDPQDDDPSDPAAT